MIASPADSLQLSPKPDRSRIKPSASISPIRSAWFSHVQWKAKKIQPCIGVGPQFAPFPPGSALPARFDLAGVGQARRKGFLITHVIITLSPGRGGCRLAQTQPLGIVQFNLMIRFKCLVWGSSQQQGWVFPSVPAWGARP